MHAPFRKLAAGGRETGGTAQVLVHDVAANAIGRSDIVAKLEIRQRSPEVLEQTLVRIGDGSPCGASFPHPHQPNGIAAERGDGIPLSRRNRS